MSDSQSGTTKRPKIVIALGIFMATCLLGTALLFILPTGSSGLPIQTCAGIVTAPKFQIGVAWASPLSSYLPPVMFSKYAVCIDLPPALAPRSFNGSLMLPP